MPPISVARVADLREGRTIKFHFRRDGIKREGFIGLHQGRIIAYENVCRHLPVSLDYADNRFFTGDGQHLVCQTHGALYDPATGLCLRGPCAGASLFKIDIELRDQKIWIESEDSV
jgi:nitrite reductase/ring-hydroxylating ferredoxin subunit